MSSGNKEMKFKVKNLSSGERSNSEEMQGNESFAHLRPSVLLRRGPLTAREAGQASLGRTLSQEEMGQNRGRHSLPCGSPGKAAFQPTQAKFSGHESDPYVPFPPLRRVQMLQIPTCTYTHTRARTHPQAYTCPHTRTCAPRLPVLPWGFQFSRLLGVD